MSGWDENLQPQQPFAHKIEDLQVLFGKKEGNKHKLCWNLLDIKLAIDSS